MLAVSELRDARLKHIYCLMKVSNPRLIQATQFGPLTGCEVIHLDLLASVTLW